MSYRPYTGSIRYQYRAFFTPNFKLYSVSLPTKSDFILSHKKYKSISNN